MSKPRVWVCLDGGGWRGLTSIELLIIIRRMFPGLWDCIEGFAGTSIGALSSALLASGREPEEVKQIFFDNRHKVFLPWGCIGPITALHNRLKRPKYRNDGLRELISDLLPGKRWGDMEKGLFVTCFDVRRREPVEPNNIPVVGDQWLSREVLVWLLGSSAAPTYFPAEGWLIDGGVYANNPSAVLLDSLKASPGGIEDVWILSIGTGEAIDFKIPDERASLGPAQWLPHILDVLMIGVVKSHAKGAAADLGERHCRIQPEGPEIPLDRTDPQTTQRLLDMAHLANLDTLVEWATKLGLERPS